MSDTVKMDAPKLDSGTVKMKAPKKQRHSTESARLRFGTNTFVSLVGAAVILVAVNYLAMRHYTRADWTSSGLYTLSDKSIKVVESLSKPVSLHMLWSAGDPSGRFEEAKEILDRYAAISQNLTVEVVDPDLKPERVKMIIDKYGARIQQDMMGQVGIEAGVFVVSGANVKFVSATDFESLDNGMDMYGGGGDPENEGLSGFKAEQSLTSAIIQVTSDDQAKICFTQGHGEWVFDERGPRGLGHIKEQLIQDGYKTEAITTTGASKIKKGCDVVLVVGPEQAFLSEEAALLEQYLAAGGKVLLFIDPLIEGTTYRPCGLEAFTAKYGIKLDKDVIFETDVSKLITDSPVTFVASEFSSHDAVKQLAVPAGANISDNMAAYPVAFSLARSLSRIKDVTPIVDILAKTSKDAWGEVDLSSLGTSDTPPTKDQYDTPGPAAVAMASALPSPDNSAEGGKLIVVGDADVLQEELFMNAGLLNRDFFSGLVGWLTKRKDLISISPKNPEHVQLNLTEEELGHITEMVWGEIVFIMVIGVMVWFRRRR